MYYDIGDNTAIAESDVIGVFDIDATTVSSRTRNYLNECEKNNLIENVTSEIPLSFIVTENKVYLSSVSSKTIYVRSKR